MIPFAFLPALAATLVASVAPAAAAPAFELSEFYAPNADLAPGYYACRSGLDFDTFTWEFDLAADGSYALRGYEGTGAVELAADGSLTLMSGPFAPDATANTYAMNTTRLSDGNTVIIIRYDFGDTVTDDYCALVE